MPAKKRSKAAAKKRGKLGNSRQSLEERIPLFVEALIANGDNATKAAIEIGYAEGSAHVAGSRLMKDPRVQKLLAERRGELKEEFKIETSRVMLELARVAFADPRKYFKEDGAIKPMHELDDDAAAALSGIDVVEMAGGMQIDAKDGDVQHIPVYTKKIRFWPKVEALDKAMRSLGLYEADNEQIGKAAAKFIYIPQKGARARS